MKKSILSFFISQLLLSNCMCSQDICCDRNSALQYCTFDVEKIPVRLFIQCLEQKTTHGHFLVGEGDNSTCGANKCESYTYLHRPYGHDAASFFAEIGAPARGDKVTYDPNPDFKVQVETTAQRFASSYSSIPGPFQGMITAYSTTDDPNRPINGYACNNITFDRPEPQMYEIRVQYINENGEKAGCP